MLIPEGMPQKGEPEIPCSVLFVVLIYGLKRIVGVSVSVNHRALNFLYGCSPTLV